MGKTAIFIFITFALGLWLEYIWKFDWLTLGGFSLLIVLLIMVLLMKKSEKSEKSDADNYISKKSIAFGESEENIGTREESDWD